MKANVIVSSAICILWSIRVFGIGFSETNNGIYLVIGGSVSTNEPIKFDERLAYMPFCDTGNIRLSQAEPIYSTKIKMLAPDGKEVAQTSLGQSFGSKFDQLHSYKDAHLGAIGASGPYQGMLSGLLPSPKELFIMEKPGVYTLEIQMQMFRYTPSLDTNEWSRNLIRFSPVKIRVEKPPENK
ncbi:MAG: hypothetical protein ACLPYZ_04280 [Limisphaerales bacterium]